MTGWRPISRRSILALGAAAAASAGLGGRAAAQPGDALSTAIEAYIFGYPLVLMDVTRAAAAANLPVNQLASAAGLPNPNSTYVVRPNLDTLYSLAWLDVRREPVLLQVPAMADDRYWLMQVLDMWTNSYQDPSSIDPRGSAPYTYAITGPGWAGSLPAGVVELPVATSTAWLIGRIQVDGPQDVAAVRDIQRQLRLGPLSSWGSEAPGTTISGMDTLGGGQGKPPEVVADMDPRTFFRRMCAVMADNPPAPEDAPAMSRFAGIGITPGDYIDTVLLAVLNIAVEVAKKRIQSAVLGQVVEGAANRWFTPKVVGVYGTDYSARASIAQLGLGANLPRDAIYLNTIGFAGGRIRYRLRFAPGQTPPNDAFWSITAYTGGGYLSPNDAGIYAVGSSTVTPGPDGSVEIAVQSEDPGSAVPQGNWLPVPDSGQFSLTMRIYAPQPQALDGRWQPPALTPQL